MNTDFLEFQLGNMAKAVSDIDKLFAELKNSICVMLGFLQTRSDMNFDNDHGGEPLLPELERTSDMPEFSQKELSDMPKQFRTLFKTNGVRARVRKRIRNNSVSYEIRLRAKGYNISASSCTLKEAKALFIRKLNDKQSANKPTAPEVPTTFDKFALYYFEKFRKRKVAADTLQKDYLRLNKYIIPFFGSMRIKDISPELCQQLMDEIADTGKGRTLEEVFSLLNCTLKIAIRHNLISHNPLDIVVHDRHERKHGKALTLEEEKRLLDESEPPFRTWFAIALYTGLRPNEYETIQIRDDMIIARNSKRKNGKTEYKRIPISPMLAKFRDKLPPQPKSVQSIRDAFNKIFGSEHKLYDLRTTFYTRCRMCNVEPAARDEFVGHSSGVLVDTYTDLPDEYLIKEAQKLDY